MWSLVVSPISARKTICSKYGQLCHVHIYLQRTTFAICLDHDVNATIMLHPTPLWSTDSEWTLTEIASGIDRVNLTL